MGEVLSVGSDATGRNMQRQHGQPSLQELREQLGEAEDRVWELETRLRETQSSTSYRLGRSLVFAAKSPRIIFRLPAQLWRLYKGRGTREDVADPAARRTGLFSSYRSLVRERQGPQIGVVASRHAVRSLASAFDVVPLWPHDVLEVASAVSPDVVLIESGAAMPGEAWSALGTTIEAGLEEVLIEVIEAFGRRSIPVLFWWTTPAERTSDLSAISSRCDFVVADDSVPGVPEATPLPLGVDLGQLQPVRPSARGDASAPLLHLSAYEPDPQLAPANRLVEASVAAGARILYEPGHPHTPEQTLWPRDVLSRYRAATWTTPTTDRLSHRCIAMLAAGVPVLVCNQESEFRQVVTEVPAGKDILDAAFSAGQRIHQPGAIANILRTVHQSGTVQHRFLEGMRSLGIETAPPDDRGVGVLIEACSDIEQAVDSIKAQSTRPTEILVDDAAVRDRLSSAVNSDIPVRPRALGESPRHVFWRDQAWPNTYLHDLVVASEVMGTDCFSDDDGPEMAGSVGTAVPMPWWIEATVG